MVLILVYYNLYSTCARVHACNALLTIYTMMVYGCACALACVCACACMHECLV